MDRESRAMVLAPTSEILIKSKATEPSYVIQPLCNWINYAPPGFGHLVIARATDDETVSANPHALFFERREAKHT